MTYYDRIANKWHAATGFQGGAFKRYVLDDHLLERITAIEKRRILELGAGNGYFMPRMLRRFSGQTPDQIVVTDYSQVLLDLARRHFRIPGAEYRVLDVRSRFPFPEGSFDLILATMVFNEVSTAGLGRALGQCRRVLGKDGRLIATVTHPAFVESLSRRRELRRTSRGVLTMPSAKGLRLPVFRRSVEKYEGLLWKHGFQSDREEVFPSDEVLREKPGLKHAGKVPLALILDCTKATIEER